MISKRILIVEDERVVAEQLQQSLSAQGYDVVGISSSGEDAVADGQRTRPDLVVMDILLSGKLDGISAAQQLQPLGIPVVYLTGYSDRHLLDRAQHTEPLAYVIKPAKTAELGAVIQLALFKHDRQTGRKDGGKSSAVPEAAEQVRLMVAGVTDYAIFTLNAAGEVNSWNRGAERINGYEGAEIIGRPHAVLFPVEDREQNVPARELEVATLNGSADNTRWMVRENGERYWAEGVLTSIRDDAGNLTGFTKIIRDGTAQKHMQETLDKTQEQLRVALHAARMGTWDWEIHTNTETFDDALLSLFGLSREDAPTTIEDFYGLIHAEDRERVKAAFERTRVEGVHLDTEFRVDRPDGSQRWLINQGEALMDDQGKPVRLTGACVDITERKQTTEALLRSEERFRLFVNNVRDYALFQMDTAGRIVAWNAGAERVLGYSEAEILGQSAEVLFVPEDVANGEPKREMDEAATVGRSEGERWHLRKDGTRFWCSGVVTAMHNGHGPLRGFAKVMRDETEGRQANQQLTASLTEKEALLKEIHHRVKNNLQVITSLLTLQSDAVDNSVVREMFEESVNRVRTIGDLHELLYRSPELASIDFDAYLNLLAQNLFSFYGVDSDRLQISVSAKDMRVDIAKAIPCGLIVNELLTNCLKHGFPAGRTGEIRVSLSCDNEECTLEVSDNGVGMPATLSIARSTSLGLKLVSVLAKQLQGEVYIDGNAGTTVKIQFPFLPPEAGR
ncbi:MAG: PAS domain S-box protein [Bryobacteraceae bacterium]|nr:PAS domain S-box protein [Bryobacteraceae bacterium]